MKNLRGTQSEHAYITITEHKPAGVWKNNWYSITRNIPTAYSEPFGNVNEIASRLENMKKEIRQKFPGIPIELVLLKIGQEPQSFMLK